MIWQGMDKRRFPRIDYPCKVVVLRSDMKKTFAVNTENIGVGGICVLLDKRLPKFCPVEVLLYLKDNVGPLECNGRVVWVVTNEKSFDTGIEFIDIREIDRLRVEKIVEKCLSNES